MGTLQSQYSWASDVIPPNALGGRLVMGFIEMFLQFMIFDEDYYYQTSSSYSETNDCSELSPFGVRALIQFPSSRLNVSININNRESWPKFDTHSIRTALIAMRAPGVIAVMKLKDRSLNTK